MPQVDDKVFGERCPQLTLASGVTLVRSKFDGFTSLRLLCTPVPDTTLEATAYTGKHFLEIPYGQGLAAHLICAYASWQIVWVACDQKGMKT